MPPKPRPQRSGPDQFLAIQQIAGAVFDCARYYALVRTAEAGEEDLPQDVVEAAERSMLVSARQLIEFFVTDSHRDDSITRRDFPQVARRTVPSPLIDALKEDKKVLDQHLSHLSWGRYPMGPHWSGLHLPQILLELVEQWAEDVREADDGIASGFSPTLTWARTEIERADGNDPFS